ncbi:PHP domain-containing protein [Bacillus sp. REN10]|uniref:PHP domain-containing protein n=1 Tax=Bacillus sp. REN10 TaxID=2782541 RepID=UPI00193B3893|nr:PHP domain-containing protein [Bacillus sp. REN10]
MDLHIHSIYSDGHWTPAEIVKEAKDKEIQVIAITDHDALEGYDIGLKVAEKEGVKLISGIELNTDGELGEMHILGYLFDAKHPKIIEHVQWRKKERLEWGRKIVEQLQLLGYSISFEDCLERAGQGVLV